MKKHILVLGGDGFCGWPTSLHLSNHGFDVTVIDNLSRRKIDVELGCNSLTPIRSIKERLAVWKELTGNEIQYFNIDIAKEFYRYLNIIKSIKPDAIVHFAEQRAAPYSMKSAGHKIYTIDNNLNATNNTLAAIVESELDIHLVHLGTMGVYGYKTTGLRIPEGYLTVKVDTDEGQKDIDIIYPPDPGSIYHLTKTQDALLFYFYNKNDGLRITDLHQGVVWGTDINESRLDERLINRFDYDGDYGTVLNRFLMQAAVKHPLTVHGTGGQTRAFIHIQNTVQCIELALLNPPKSGDPVEIFNQSTETHTVINLAKKVSELTGAEIRCYDNPRKEAKENNLIFCNDKFLELGLTPVTLDDGLLTEVYDIANKYSCHCDASNIICTSLWTKSHKKDLTGKPTDEC